MTDTRSKMGFDVAPLATSSAAPPTVASSQTASKPSVLADKSLLTYFAASMHVPLSPMRLQQPLTPGVLEADTQGITLPAGAARARPTLWGKRQACRRLTCCCAHHVCNCMHTYMSFVGIWEFRAGGRYLGGRRSFVLRSAFTLPLPSGRHSQT